MAGFGTSMQGIADQLLTLFGGGRQVTLRRYDEVPNLRTGATGRVLAQTITAPVVVDTWKRGELDGHRFGDLKLIISGKSISADPPVDGSWTAELPGEREYPIVLPINSIAPDGNAVVWEANMRRGAGGAG